MNRIFKYFLILFIPLYADAKIYDCFLFFNELEVLELRLEELHDVVDKFVIVEANEGFRGHSKPFNFELNREKFKKFEDKIIYIKLNEHIDTDNPWVREHWQRNQIMRGLKECEADDLIMISDVDEYIPAEIVPNLYASTAYWPMIGFWQMMYRYFLNRWSGQVWAGTATLRYKDLVSRSPQAIRDLVRGAHMSMWHCGWHFTSIGGFERLQEKIKNYSHGTDEEIHYEDWRKDVDKHHLVEINESFPEYVQKNIDYLFSKNLIEELK